MSVLSRIGAAALLATLTFSGSQQLGAAPLVMPATPSATSDVVQVRDGVRWRRNHWNGGNYDRWSGRTGAAGNNFRRDGNYAWYNGHRGYRNHRHGYRNYNGFWFPAGAFVAGAIIGGALADDGYYGGGYGPRYYLDGNPGGSHVQWCYNRYRSYRAYDNTFQPYHGPRQQCYSPYD